ncbi:MAG: histidine phosphatase family protein [Paracoccaceae bacterium]
MTRLHLVRHGPTHAKSMVGWSDLPADLSDTGLVSRVSSFLPAEAIVISSDLSRAADTATAIGGDRMRLPHDPDLREINFGDWELRRFNEVEAEDPHTIRAFWETPGETRPPNGESWDEVLARVSRAVDRLIAAHTGRDIVVVAHFGAILTQVQRAHQMTADQVFAHKIDNFSITEIHHADAGWDVRRINHLP